MRIREMKIDAKEEMRNNYGLAILNMILFGLITAGSLFLGLFIGLIIVSGAIKCSRISFYMDIANRKATSFDSTFKGFKLFGKAFKASFLIGLIYFAIALPILVGVVLNIIMAGQSFMFFVTIGLVVLSMLLFLIIGTKLKFVFHVMVADPDLKAGECIAKSMKMTKRNVFKLIWFEISFVGWYILVLLTFGALNLRVSPYHDTALTNFFYELWNNVD